MPVEGTNTFFVVVDNERSSDPICKPVSCPCDPVSQLLNLLIFRPSFPSVLLLRYLLAFSPCVCALCRSNRAAVCLGSVCVPVWRRYHLKTTILASRALPDSGLFVRERERERERGSRCERGRKRKKTRTKRERVCIFIPCSAHVCPPLTGLQDHSVTMVTNPIDEGVKACYPQNCSQK